MEVRQRAWVFVLFFVLTLSTGCLTRLVPPPPTAPPPTVVWPLYPTYTPTPTSQPTPTFTPIPTSTFTPTALPTPTPLVLPSPTVPLPPTPTPTPTPYVEVTRGRVNVRTGPGLQYPLLGQLLPGTRVPIVGRDPSGKWWHICCVDGQSAWIASWVVEAYNDISQVPLVANIPPPPPTPTPRPTPPPTPTPTPAPLYTLFYGPVAIPSTNPILTVWVKVADSAGQPVVGTNVRVYYGGQVMAETTTMPQFGYTRPSPAFGFYHPYNAKLEVFSPPAGKYELAILEGGREVIPRVVFYRAGDTPGAEFYLAFQRR